MPLRYFELAPIAVLISLHFNDRVHGWYGSFWFSSFSNIPRLPCVSNKRNKRYYCLLCQCDSRMRNRGETLHGKILSPFWCPLYTKTGSTLGNICWMNKWIYYIIVYLLNPWKDLATFWKMHPSLSLIDSPESEFAAVRQIEKLVSHSFSSFSLASSYSDPNLYLLMLNYTLDTY